MLINEEDKNKASMNKPYNIQNTNICNGIFHISFFKALLINQGERDSGRNDPVPFKQIQRIKWIVGGNRLLYRGIKYNIIGLIPKTIYVTQTLIIKYRGTIEPRATR